MKKNTKLISLLLVLSLLFSSLVFTTGAAEATEPTNKFEDVELYDTTADYVKLTANDKDTLMRSIFKSGKIGGVQDVYGNGRLDSYYVTSKEDGNSYIMVVPTDEAVKKNTVPAGSHSQINTNMNETFYYDAANPTYYVVDMDIATESTLFPMKYQVVARGSASAWGANYVPSATFTSAITPGKFHHVTFVADVDNNVLYVFVNNLLVDSLKNGITNDDYFAKYKAGDYMRIECLRLQQSPDQPVPADSSICYDNISERVVRGANAGNMAECIANGSLKSWTKNDTTHNSEASLPSLIEVNGVTYNNTVEAIDALDTYKLGNTAKVLRSCYSAPIVVNCDAVIKTSMSEVKIKAGSDVTVAKGDNGTWIATLKSFKPSAVEVSSAKNVYDITSYVRYSASDNLISYIGQSKAVNARVFTEAEFNALTDAQKALVAPGKVETTNPDGSKTVTYNLTSSMITEANSVPFSSVSVDGKIISTDGGNEYLIIEDSTDAAGDFPLNVHYQINANTPLKYEGGVFTNAQQYNLQGHDYVVFEQDIYSESTFIDIYCAFNLRKANNTPLSSVQTFVDNIDITPEKWYHLTFVGDTATGNSYVFLDGMCVSKVVGGLYDSNALNDMASYLGIENNEENRSTLVNNMVLASFRTMQIAGENKSGKTLTPEMSAASDNYYLRWADNDQTMIDLLASIDADFAEDKTIDSEHNINNWSHNIFTENYIATSLPERAVLATVDGVEYYDTTSINELLNDTDYTTTLKEIVIYREFIGTINVNCRATVNTNGISCHVAYDSDLITEASGNVTKVYKQTDADIPDTVVQVPTYDSFAKYKLAGSVSASNVRTAWLSSKSNNRYASHTLGNASNTQTLQTLTGYNNGAPTYGNDTIVDTGAQTHTLTLSTTNSQNSAASTASVSVSGSYSNSSKKVTITNTITETQYYVVMDFDIAKIGTQSINVSSSLTKSGSSTATKYSIADLKSYLSDGEFSHVTVVGTVEARLSDIVNNVDGITSSTNNRYTVTASQTSSISYVLVYKVFVNNELKTTVEAATSTTAFSAWTNMIIETDGGYLAVDNVFIGTGSQKETRTVSTTATGSSANNTKNQYNNNTDTKTITQAEQAALTPTVNSANELANVFAASNLSGTNYAGTAEDMPAIEYDQSAEESVQTGTAPETIPGTQYPIACVDGTLYYAENEAELKALLESESVNELYVTFLREPTVSISITSNVKLDYNGLELDNVTVDADECVSVEGENSTTIVNLQNTTFIATMNGVDYVIGEEDKLQAAITAAKKVEIEFYRVPSVALMIACEAKIDTNGLISENVSINDLITTDFTDFSITSASGTEYTIVAQVKYATVQVNLVNGGTIVDTIKVTGELGTDIKELLTDKGLMSGAFIVGGNKLNLASWDVEPSGMLTTTDTYTFTANVDADKTTEITAKYASIATNGTIAQTDNASDAAKWFGTSNIETIILNDDLVIPASGNGSTTVYGTTKNIYLNGHTLTNSSTDQGFSINGNVKSFNFVGEGTINYVTNNLTHSLFFANYDFTGKIYVSNANLNITARVTVLRSGSLELNGCTVDAFAKNADSLFFLGEQYNGYSQNAIHLTLKDSDISYRYADTTKNYPIINNKIVTDKLVRNEQGTFVNAGAADDAKRVIVIDGCSIKSQGSLVDAYSSGNGAADSYLKSNMTLYVNDTDLMLKSLTSKSIKENSIIFYDDVRTNIESKDNIAFSTDLVIAKTSDGIYKVLYTSHDYATITWSNGKTEFWATGSTPTNPSLKFDNVTAGGVGEGQADTQYVSTGNSFPFKLYSNLTLAGTIGYNVYVPVSTVGNYNNVQVYMDGKLISPNTYADSNAVRETVVAVAGTTCYDYTLTLAPQVAAKEFTLVIIYNGQSVSRKVSVMDYAEALVAAGLTEKTTELLKVALNYIEQATIYSGNTIDLTRLTALKKTLGTTTVAPTAPVAPSVEHSETKADFGEYIRGVQINVRDNCSIRFNLKDGVDASKFQILVANDNNDGYNSKTVTVAEDGSYVELSIRAYEMPRQIKLVLGGEYDFYSIYDYYVSMSELANATITVNGAAYITGQTHEYKAALKLIEAIYSYASVCDKYLDRNAAEYDPSNQ